MAGLREHVEAELVEIAGTLAMLPKGRSCSSFSSLELAGVAAVLQGFYNGIENILRSIIRAQCRQLPEGPTSHRELLNMAEASGLLAADMVRKLGPYMQFRHFMRHS